MHQLASNLYLETSYPGVNVMAATTRRGIICIDTPTFPRDARVWATRVHKLYPYMLDFLVLTDPHGDRILNSRWFAAPIIAQRLTETQLQQYEKRYPQALLDSLLARLPDSGRDLFNGPVGQPALSFGEKLTLDDGQQRLELIHMPGPSTGTVWVHFPHAKALFVSDSVVNGEHPCLLQADGEAWLNSLDKLLHDPCFADVEHIIPGRGVVCDRSAIPPLVDYLHQALDCVRHHLQAGRPREELSAYVPQFTPQFPTQRWPRSWTQKQIRTGLEHLYDQIQLMTPAGAS